MSCKGVCNRIDTPHRESFTEKRFYREGMKYCRTCSIFILYDGVWCPCCNQRVSSKSKASRYRKVGVSVC